MKNIKTFRTLEYDKVLDILKKYAVSTHTRDFIAGYTPLDDIDEIKYELHNVEEAGIILYELALSPNLFYDNIEDELLVAEKHGMLSMAEILKITVVMHNVRLLKATIDTVNHENVYTLHDIAGVLYPYPKYEEDVERCIVNETEMADNASTLLRDIRREIKSTKETIIRKLNSFITDSKYQRYLQDNLITVRSNRQVLPVKSEFRSQIPGLIHDESSSKGTVYIEPFVIVELNNKLKSLYIDENNEKERILRDFTDRIRLIADNMRVNLDTMCYLDFVFAKAKYAHATRAILPNIVDNGDIDIVNGRHPLLDSKKVVPITLYLKDGKSILVITGSNTGGKTVSLKLVGLFTLMTMSGMFIPADEGTTISIYDNIFSDIGDEQSIEQSLSTFSSHITNLIDITTHMTNKSLILLDELGNGTDPIEGSAIAIAIIKKMVEIGARAIVTTHYNEVKEYAFSSDNMITASMDFDADTFKPTYRLLMGVVGSSNAIEIASRLGLDRDIIESARSLISDEKMSFDKIMNSAEIARKRAEQYAESIKADKVELENKLNDIEKERALIKREHEKLNENINKEAKKLLAEYMEEADDLVEELKEQVKVKNEQSLFKARNIRSKLSQISYEEEPQENIMKFDSTPIQVGDDVYIKKIDNVGTVVSINRKKKEYSVKAGIMSMNIKFNEARKVVKSKEQPTVKVHYARRPVVEESHDTSYEINVIGKDLIEATFEVDQFIDSAVLGGYKEVRIVHGKGTGVLRNGLRAHFRKHPNVESFHEGAYGEGDAGVTILVLK